MYKIVAINNRKLNMYDKVRDESFIISPLKNTKTWRYKNSCKNIILQYNLFFPSVLVDL